MSDDVIFIFEKRTHKQNIPPIQKLFGNLFLNFQSIQFIFRHR